MLLAPLEDVSKERDEERRLTDLARTAHEPILGHGIDITGWTALFAGFGGLFLRCTILLAENGMFVKAAFAAVITSILATVGFLSVREDVRKLRNALRHGGMLEDASAAIREARLALSKRINDWNTEVLRLEEDIADLGKAAAEPEQHEHLRGRAALLLAARQDIADDIDRYRAGAPRIREAAVMKRL